MSKSLLVWLGGMLSLLGGQRLFVSSDTVSIALTVLGLAALVVGLVFRVQARGRSTDQHAQAAHKGALLLMGLGFAAVGVYFGSTTTDDELVVFVLSAGKVEELRAVVIEKIEKEETASACDESVTTAVVTVEEETAR